MGMKEGEGGEGWGRGAGVVCQTVGVVSSHKIRSVSSLPQAATVATTQQRTSGVRQRHRTGDCCRDEPFVVVPITLTRAPQIGVNCSVGANGIRGTNG